MAALTNREKAVIVLETLTNEENGYTHKEILEHIINNVLSGEKAIETMNFCIEEFPSPDFKEDDEEEETEDGTEEEK